MVAAPPRKRTILDDAGNAHEYNLELFGAMEGITLGTKLMEMLAGALDVKSGATSMIQGLVRGLVAAGEQAFILRLLALTSRDGQRLDERHVFEAAYRGNYGELLRAIEFAVEANFEGFSGAAADVLGRRLVQMFAPSPESSSSWLTALLTGSSGPSSPPDSGAKPKSSTGGP